MKSKALLVIVGLLFSAVLSHATNIKQVDATYKSGATFSGLLTFTDSYDNLVDVDGILNGGGWTNEHLTWIWSPSTNYAASFGANLGGNFLMNGSSTSDYSAWITISWDYSNPNDIKLVTPNSNILSPNGGNNINYTDPLVSSRVGGNSVPDACSTFGLLSVGFIALVISRRKR